MNSILVIDDDDELLEIVGIILTPNVLKVKPEPRWEDGAAEIENFDPGIIVLDFDQLLKKGKHLYNK